MCRGPDSPWEQEAGPCTSSGSSSLRPLGDQRPSPEEDGGGHCRRTGGAAWGRWAGGKAVETQGARSPP